jgi:glucokinase
VCNAAAGSALLSDEPLVARLVRAVVAAVAVPVTVKMRTGPHPGWRNAVRIARIAEAEGVAALAVHGRTRACAFVGEVEYDTIAAVRAAVTLPLFLENDANAAAWAEYRFGAGKGEDFLVCVTVGTGIGGGLVLNGQLYRGRFGIGAEFGHMQVVPDGRRCGCGQRGCWEQYCSGRALLHEAREIADVQPEFGKRLLELGGGEPEGIEAREVTQAAIEGDRAALDCFHEIGTWLGQGLADLASLLDPGVFVIGGGVADAGKLLLEPAQRAYAEKLTGTGHRPLAEIRLARLGNEAGLVGAADLARSR